MTGPQPTVSQNWLLQKAVLPAWERLWLNDGETVVCGFVVPAPDVAWARTAAQVHDAMGLGFPGSPIPAEAPFIDVLRFEANRFIRPIAAIGRNLTARAGHEPVADSFVDRPPFTGNGFAPNKEGRRVLLWWIDPVRVPPRAELWRIYADGTQEMRAIFPHVALGWQRVEKVAEKADTIRIVGPWWDGSTPQLAASDVCGVFTDWHGTRVAAEVLGNGRAVLTSNHHIDGFKRTERFGWAKTVDDSEVEPYGVRLTCRWRGLPFQMIRRVHATDGEIGMMMIYIGRDADEAEAAGLTKTDAGVYIATAMRSEMTDGQAVQLIPVN